MPWSTGSFSLLYDWVARRDAGSPTNVIGATEMLAQEQDLADGLEACLKANGDIPATANIPMGGFGLTNVAASTLRTQYARVAELQDSSHTWIAGAGTADAITATYAPSVAALTNGCLVGFRASAANVTTTPTFAPNGLTAKTIVKGANTALVAGDIPGQHHECLVRYNSSLDKWVLLNPYDAQYAAISAIQTDSYTWIAGGGTADAITATYAPALAALTNGTLVGVRATAANATTTPTFAPNGLTAKTIVKAANTALVAGDIAGNHHELLLRYNSSTDKWHLLNPTYPAGVSTIDLSTLTIDATLGDMADYLAGYDVSGSDSNRALVSSVLYNAFNTATADTTPDPDADHIMSRDDSASGNKKIIIKNLAVHANADSIGYKGAPVVAADSTTSFALTDCGKTWYHTSGSTHTWTIPANASVAFPIGTIILLENESGGGNVTIAITSDTLRWTSSTGSRTLAANGSACLKKVAATVWRLTGSGIT